MNALGYKDYFETQNVEILKYHRYFEVKVELAFKSARSARMILAIHHNQFKI
jgi:hypothetical protein